jgi:hypothetical protein
MKKLLLLGLLCVSCASAPSAGDLVVLPSGQTGVVHHSDGEVCSVVTFQSTYTHLFDMPCSTLKLRSTSYLYYGILRND